MLTSPSLALAITTLVYYVPTLFPLCYTLHTHRHSGLLGWTFLLIFVLLQITGSALTISSGGHTTSTAATLTGVGISPLLLGTAGVLHECMDLTSSSQTKEGEENGRKMGWAVVLLYHFFVVTGVALYAVGRSKIASTPPEREGKILGEAGVMILLLAWIALAGACWWISSRHMERKKDCRALMLAVQISVGLLGLRVVYACVSTFSSAKVFEIEGGNIALKVVFDFLLGAVVVAVLITGGVLTRRVGSDGMANSLE